jgi:hypothetical protein
VSRVDELDGGILVSNERGCVLTVEVLPSVVFFRFEKHVGNDMFEPSVRICNRALDASKSITMIGDGGNWDGYDAGYRNQWTDWFIKNRKRITAVHLLTRSAIVRMGVQVVNLMTNNIIQPYASAPEFRRALLERVPKFDAMSAKWPAART